MSEERAIGDNLHCLVVCPCCWTGNNSELKPKGTITNADNWWECPRCGRDGSEMDFKAHNA
jgi:hypothetical protein